MSRRSPFTALGYGALGGFGSSYLVGWFLGWIEFVAVAVGFAAAVVIALPFVVGGKSLALHREVSPQRIEVGKTATSVLTITNDGRSPSAPRIIEDRIAGMPLSLDIPALAPGASSQAPTKLPTDQRGVVAVGPAVVSRSDPLGLLRRDLNQTGVTRLWVHPRVIPLNSLRSGFTKDLEGPTFDTSPAGDIAFHAIREYAQGDDIRHIHWMSTARTGSLMVRHYVDNRQPYLGVLIDNDLDAVDANVFERALEAAASQVVSAAIDGRPLAVWVGEQEIMSGHNPAERTSALDRLCLSVLDKGPDLSTIYERLRTADPQVSALCLVTGDRPAAELLPLSIAARRHGAVVVIRFVKPETDTVSLPGVTVLDCCNLEQFVSAWSVLVR